MLLASANSFLNIEIKVILSIVYVTKWIQATRNFLCTRLQISYQIGHLRARDIMLTTTLHAKLIRAISEKMIFDTHKNFQSAAADRKDATIGVIMISRVRNVCKIMK